MSEKNLVVGQTQSGETFIYVSDWAGTAQVTLTKSEVEALIATLQAALSGELQTSVEIFDDEISRDFEEQEL